MKLIEQFNKFRAEQHEKNNQRLLKSFEKARASNFDDSIALTFLALLIPPLLVQDLYYEAKEAVLEKVLKHRGVPIPPKM